MLRTQIFGAESGLLSLYFFERDFFKLVKYIEVCADSSARRAPFRITFLRFIRCRLNDRFTQLVRTGSVKSGHKMEKVTVKTPPRWEEECLVTK